jgi:hypothetical protein
MPEADAATEGFFIAANGLSVVSDDASLSCTDDSDSEEEVATAEDLQFLDNRPSSAIASERVTTTRSEVDASNIIASGSRKRRRTAFVVDPNLQLNEEARSIMDSFERELDPDWVDEAEAEAEAEAESESEGSGSSDIDEDGDPPPMLQLTRCVNVTYDTSVSTDDEFSDSEGQEDPMMMSSVAGL